MALVSRIRIGRMDRRITIQSNSPTPDSLKQLVDSWSNVSGLANIPAQKIELSGAEQFESQQEAALVNVAFVIRYTTTAIDATMRVVYGTTNYKIERVEEVGRRHGLVLYTYNVT